MPLYMCFIIYMYIYIYIYVCVCVGGGGGGGSGCTCVAVIYRRLSELRPSDMYAPAVMPWCLIGTKAKYEPIFS